MPDTVQFRNGNQIINTYASDGRKLKSRYYTPIPGMFNPITVTEGSVFRISGYPDYFFDMEATAYVGNKEYEVREPKHYHYLGLKRIHNSEGYVQSGKYNYYRCDHLGNNWEVWQTDGNTLSTIQRTNYYASGLPWAYKEGDGASEQPYKYNGKEYIEMHGYDVTDLGNRGVYNTINRFTTMDRFAEKFPWQSPYVHAANNPVNYVDIRGDSIIVANDKSSRDDIASIVNENNREHINYDENGNMTLDFGNMSEKQIKKVLKRDKGLNLLNNMINAKNDNGTAQYFFYATTNERIAVDNRTGEVINITLNRPEGTVLIDDNSFATSLTNSGNDTRAVLRAEPGYDGTIRISPGTMFNRHGNGEEYKVPRNKLIFHELSENYLMTNKKMTYQEAHRKAGGIGNFTKFIWGK